MAVARIRGIGLVTADRVRLTRFYRDVLGFRAAGAERRTDAFGGGVDVTRLGLGDQTIELLEFDRPGAAYPPDPASNDRLFQHLAIVVADIEQAYAHLGRHSGWTPTSRSGPEHLPAGSGGVSAFKFRDPEGHPLELLQFPSGAWPAPWTAPPDGGLFVGIDHTAIVVDDLAISLAFYAREFGWLELARSTNRGAEQARLDDIPDVEVEVVAVGEAGVAPHLEMLCYRPGGRARVIGDADIASTRIDVSAGPRVSRDPDGHRLVRYG